MKLEHQVVSLELAKKLEALGIPQKSYFMWIPTMQQGKVYENAEKGKYSVAHGKKHHNLPKDAFGDYDVPIYSAYTVAELGELLPTEQNDRLGFFSGRAINGWFCEVKNYGVMPFERLHVELQHDTEANARAAMLIYLIENNHIKV